MRDVGFTKILILDDDRTHRQILKSELCDEGFEVIESSGSFRLLNLIERERPHVVILNPHLGAACDGLDLLSIIRNTYYNLPVILWAASAADEWDPRCMAADYQLVKSTDMGQLKGIIARVLETRMTGYQPVSCKLMKAGGREGSGGSIGLGGKIMGETMWAMAER